MAEMHTDWREIDGVATAWFDAASLVEGAMLAGRLVELAPGILVDLRPTGMQVRLSQEEHAEAVSEAARDLGFAANPAALQRLSVVVESANPSSVVPFWQDVLDYAPGQDGDLSDRLRRDPAIRIRGSSDPRPLRNRIHLDVSRPAAEVEQANLGEGSGPYGVRHADLEGNEVDVVPGSPLGEGMGVADWQAVFSAMACYRTTSPTQQRDLVAAVAALADDAGFPLLIDRRPGLLVIDSGKDQWENEAHGLELDFTDLAANIQSTARDLGAAADLGLPRFVQLFFATPPTSPRSARSGSPPSATNPTRERESATFAIRAGSTQCWSSKSSTLRRRSGAGSATASTSSSPCHRTSRGPAWPQLSLPVVDSLRSPRIAGGWPTQKATNWSSSAGLDAPMMSTCRWLVTKTTSPL